MVHRAAFKVAAIRQYLFSNFLSQDAHATLQPSLVYVAVEEPLATIHWAAVDADLVVETIVSSITKESP